MSTQQLPEEIELLELTPEQVANFKDRMGLLPTLATRTPEEDAEAAHFLEEKMRARK